MYCPKCGKELEKDASFCGYCGYKFVKEDDESVSGKTIDQIEQQTQSQFSFKQPIRNLVILSVFTFGLYEIYWFYRNWKQIKIHKNLDISPGMRTLGLLFIPIYNFLLIFEQFKDIMNLAKEAGCSTFSSHRGLATVYIYMTILFNILFSLPPPYSLIGWIPLFLSLWVLIIIQKTLNNYWEKEQVGLPERTQFSGIEIAAIIIGGFILIVGFYISTIIGAT
ncbi:MAG: zinc-ribbon domain-containing protein [Candidatus Methanoperedens sp.]|nr:zinc-ribbon domain-containing protein [Candidatus Methanoperedens sp.]